MKHKLHHQRPGQVAKIWHYSIGLVAKCFSSGKRSHLQTEIYFFYWDIHVAVNQEVSIYGGWFIVFNTTFNNFFNNISVILWQSVLLVEETGVPRENNQPVASFCQKFISHNVVWSTPRLEQVQTHNSSGDRPRLNR